MVKAIIAAAILFFCWMMFGTWALIAAAVVCAMVGLAAVLHRRNPTIRYHFGTKNTPVH